MPCDSAASHHTAFGKKSVGGNFRIWLVRLSAAKRKKGSFLQRQLTTDGHAAIMGTESDLTRAARYSIPFLLLLIPLWRTRIASIVPEPYLDEVFHVGQAQTYWAHKWSQWDHRITTPPGLYLWSYLVCSLVLVLRGSPRELNAEALRTTNTAAAAIFLPWRLQTLLDSIRGERNTRPAGARLGQTVLNICLFPPLFFFSGLYYTDVLALLAVIEAYNWDIKGRRRNSPPSTTLVFMIFGLGALLFRQTNIFWVAVFLGGLRVVWTLRQSSRDCTASDLRGIVDRSSKNELYDPTIMEASVTGEMLFPFTIGKSLLLIIWSPFLADYFKTSVSLAINGLSNVRLALISAIPYVTILAAFGGFVLWNNGVVLGELLRASG